MVKIGQIFKHKNGRRHSLHEKCPYSQLLWSAFSRIWTEYGEILLISNLRIFSPNEGNVDQNNSEYRQFFAVIISIHQNIYSVSVTDHPMSFKHWGGFTISRELILKMNASSWHLLPYFYPFPKVEECYTNVRWIVTFNICRQPPGDDFSFSNSSQWHNQHVGNWLSSPKQKSQISQNKFIWYNTMLPVENLLFYLPFLQLKYLISAKNVQK